MSFSLPPLTALSCGTPLVERACVHLRAPAHCCLAISSLAVSLVTSCPSSYLAVTRGPTLQVKRKIAQIQWLHKQLGNTAKASKARIGGVQNFCGESCRLGKGGVRVRYCAKKCRHCLGGRRSMSTRPRSERDWMGARRDGLVKEEVLELARTAEMKGTSNGAGDGSEDGKVDVVALDIGGTLSKVIYHDGTSETPSTSAPDNTIRLRCQIWPTKHIEQCFAHIQSQFQNKFQSHSQLRISATGGGAIKYATQLSALARSIATSGSSAPSTASPNDGQLETQDEMACLAAGLSSLTTSASQPTSLYTFDSISLYPSTDTTSLPVDPSTLCHPVQLSASRRPILLANVGTGASFVLCPSQHHQETEAPSELEPARRIGGTPLTGTTLIGILKLITGKADYAEILALAETGDSRKVDLTVADVYGAGYASVGLEGHRAAGFLGRVATGMEGGNGSAPVYSQADVARSLVFAIGYNIGQQAVLQARVNGAAREICFAGSFGGGHPLVMGALDYAVRMNGGGEFRATFLRGESYLGVVGAWALGRVWNKAG